MSASTPLHTAALASHTPQPSRLVTDAPTRMFHALFALCFAGAYVTADSEHWRLLHVTLGYSFAGLLAWRLIYGVVGPKQVRLGLLWRKLAGAPAWWRAVRSSPQAWFSQARQAQNLAMAAAILCMLALVVPLTLSGYATYNEWGSDWGGVWGAVLGEEGLEELHELMGNAFLAVVLAHTGLIALLSLLRRQNMARPMLSGTTGGSGPSPVKHNRRWLAALLLMVWLGFVAQQML